MIIYCIIVLSIFSNISECFNIDVNAPIIKSGRSNTSFGFSVLGHTLSASNRGIIIGSPKSGINGEVFWCPSSQSTCQRIDVDVSKLARMNPKMNDALLGYSMASLRGDEPGKVTVCAPRLVRSSVSLDYVTGGCFELDSELQNPSAHSASMSICQDIPKSANVIDLRHCTIGATVGRHPSAPNELFMGGPYFYYGKGMGVILDTQEFTHTQTSVEGLLPNMLIGSSLDISDRIFAPRSGSDRSVYAAYGGPGVPVIDNYLENVGTGTVLFFPNFKAAEEISIRPVLRVDGQKFGSRFGHSLILVDINGDNWEDLIVGAPYEKLEAQAGSQSEYGAVHVFLNLQNNFSSPVNDLSEESLFTYQPRNAHQLLTPLDKHHDCGTTPISAYGSTLVELGDINHDGFQDFAVGAPYGAGGGIVFIYHGSKTGRIGLPAQVICTAKLAIQNTLNGFGFSMGLKGLDLDGNGYADMAIGAPLSDSVVVLRSRPIIKFDAHITLEDGSTVIPANLDTLSDCTMEALTLPGYKARKVRCLDTRVFMTYTSIDGLPCKYDKRYKVSLLLKANPVNAWLAEWTDPDEDQMGTITRDRRKAAGQCALSHKSTEQHNVPNAFQIYRDLAIAPVSFIGERSVLEFGNQSDPFFTVNKSANSAGVQSPGGYLSVELEATCRELSDVLNKTLPSPKELVAAKKLRLVFRDVNLIDQTRPIAIGARWVAHTPPPFPMADNIHEFPISNPRENSQLIELTFDNQCTTRICCPHLRVSYSADITRDKNGPVVYVGDDNAQTIQIKVQVTNIGADPAYMLNLISSYSPNLLELDPSVRSHLNVAPNAASCHLANPLWPGQSAECTLRWLVIGHQLAVQMAQFSVNSSVVTGAEAPVTVEGSLTHELLINIKMIANISITGTIDPNTVYFSGNVSDGISSILAENQIGDSQLLIKFTVRNQRIHSLVPDSRLIIDWPYEIAGDITETHGKYMLYLLENPSVVQHQLIIPGESAANTSSVVCDSLALTRLVNPHGYRIFSFLKPSIDGVPVQTAPVELPSGHPSIYPPLSSTMMIEDVPERLADSKQREQRKMTTISCYNGQLRCVPIVCDLGKLSYKAGPITLEFNARLWDNTMREEFKPIFLTKLHISATWRADVKYGIDLGDSDHAQNIYLGKCYPFGKWDSGYLGHTQIELPIFNNLQPKPIAPKYMILYISLAVFGGVLLLAVIIIILKKAGFFKRKRFVRRQKRTPKEPKKQPTTSEYVVGRTAREVTQAHRQPTQAYDYVPDSRDSHHSTYVSSPITAYQQSGQSRRHDSRPENRSSAVSNYANRQPHSTGSGHYR